MLKLLIGVFLFSSVLGILVPYNGLYVFKISLFAIIIYSIITILKQKKFLEYLKTVSKVHFFLYFLLVYYMATYFLVEYSFNDYTHFIRNFIKDILISLVIIYFISNKIENLKYTLKILFFAYFVEILFGLLQLYPSIYMPNSTVNYISSIPTGFMNNRNDFGFVLSLITPYILFLIKNKKLQYILLALILIIILFIGSIVALICFNLAIIIYFIINKQFKNMMYIYSIFIVLFIIASSVNILPKTIANKVFNIEKIVNYINPDAKSSNLTGSAKHKHQVIKISLNKLKTIQYIGVGAGQSYSVLKEHSSELDEKNYSVHSFWVEMFMESGIYFFVLFLIFYIYLIIRNFQIFLNCKNHYLSYVAISNSVALIVFILASNSPSSVFHIYTTWILFGLSIATLSISNVKQIKGSK
jgi:teichuronic acid biosynthesis protein TuaE